MPAPQEKQRVKKTITRHGKKKKSDDTTKNIAICTVNFFLFHFLPPLNRSPWGRCTQNQSTDLAPGAKLASLNELKNHCGGLRA
jgi:hypothetical protein